MRAPFMGANQLRWVADKAAEASKADALQNLVAILFSAAYIEASINELLEQVTQAEGGALAAFKPIVRAAGLEERTAPIHRKIHVLGVAASGKDVDFGSPPLQDLDLLLGLRNWLVHLRPEMLNLKENSSEGGTSLINEDYHELVNRLAERKVIKLPTNYLVAVITAAQLDGVAGWSVRTADDAVAQLKAWIPDWRLPIVGSVEAVR